jgi:hypothetical protein
MLHMANTTVPRKVICVTQDSSTSKLDWPWVGLPEPVGERHQVTTLPHACPPPQSSPQRVEGARQKSPIYSLPLWGRVGVGHREARFLIERSPCTVPSGRQTGQRVVAQANDRGRAGIATHSNSNQISCRMGNQAAGDLCHEPGVKAGSSLAMT